MVNEQKLKELISSNLCINECKSYMNGNIRKEAFIKQLSEKECPPAYEFNCKREINCYECWKGYLLDII